jgi:hypothetical protein
MIKIVYKDKVIDKFDNEYCIRVFALKRAGQHAIINWIAHHFDKLVLFINDVKINKDPFIYFNHRGNNEKNNKLPKYYINYKNEDLYSYKQIKNKILIINYEDVNLEKDKFEEKYYGIIDNFFNVLILRDPFNNFASRYKRKNRDAKTLEFINLWKDEAREFLGKTLYLKNKICISYNDWFKNKEYRKKISSSLNLFFTDDGLEKILPVRCWGSSFDGRKYDGKAQQMDVLNRWKIFKDDKLYRKFFEDEEIWELSEKIFGKIEGTEVLRK